MTLNIKKNYSDSEGGRAYLVEVVPDDLPDAGPLQADPAHVVVGDLYDLLQAEHAGVRKTGEFIHRHGTQRLHKLNCNIAHVARQKQLHNIVL